MFNPLNTLSPVWMPDPVIRAHPLNHGRLAWWMVVPPLDGGRQWFDLMAGRPANLVNMTTSALGWRASSRPGGLGHMLCDGSNAYVLSSAFPTTTGAFTFACWFRRAASGYRYLISHDNNLNAGWRIGYSSGNALEIVFGAIYDFTSFVPAVGDWWFYCVTVTGQSGTATAYAAKAGNPLGTQSLAVGTTTGTPNQITIGGTSWNATLQHNGAIDDLGIWNRVLSAAEIQNLYDLSRQGYPGLLRRWPPMGVTLMTLPPLSPVVPLASYLNRRRRVG